MDDKSSNQSFDERMRPRNLRNGFDFGYAEDSQIRFPLMNPIQRIMIGTQIPWEGGHASNGLLEHATQCFTVDNANMDAKANNPAWEVVHHHEHPCVRNSMDSQRNKSSDP
jgi:hypothetical protein